MAIRVTAAHRWLWFIALPPAIILAWWLVAKTPLENHTSDPPDLPWFVDITEEAQVHFLHDAGPEGKFFLPQIIGSGAAVLDCNNDGLLDLYFLQNGGPQGASNRLFQQLPNGRFQDVSVGSGLDFPGYNMGVAVGDINNDGRTDVVVTQLGGLQVLLNEGQGRFRAVTAAAGINNPYWGTSTCLVDLDRDGWLDLVVANYVAFDPGIQCPDARGWPSFCHPSSYPGSPSKIYLNRTRNSPTRQVKFIDVSQAAGVARLPERGLGVVGHDFTGDGWPDIFVANDAGPNHLWVNQRDGTFREEAVLRGLAFSGMGQALGNMGIALGDVDGDGLLDVFVTHLTEETHTLWRQGPVGQFHDATTTWGITRSAWRGTGFGTLLADFDHDGRPDLAITNGRVVARRAEKTFSWQPYRERNQLFANDGGEHFRDISESNNQFCGLPMVGRGLLAADLDNDGALDLIVTQVAGPAKIYRNVAPRRGHWLQIRAILPKEKRDALGAVIHVGAGGRRWVGLANPGQSYLCSNDPRAHFGLGPIESIDTIEVTWPDGTKEIFPGGPVDRLVVLEKDKGSKQ